MSVIFDENNKKNGEEKVFYEDGSIKNICYWENGVQQGSAETFNENGKLIKKSNIVNGNYHGEQIEYYPSGNIKIRRFWVDNFKSQEYEYNLDGDLICEYKNDGNKVKQTNYYKNGNIRFQVEKPIFADDRKKDDFHEYNSYWLNGKLMCKSKFDFQYYADRRWGEHKKQLIEEKYLENGEVLNDAESENEGKKDYYNTGERKKSVSIETKPGVGDLEVKTGYYKNGNTKYIKYYKRLKQYTEVLYKGLFDTECYGNWIFYSKSGEVLNERKFIIGKKPGDNYEYSKVVNVRNEDVFKKVIDELTFNISLGSISKNKEYTYYLINISLADEEYNGIDLFKIQEEDYCIIGDTQLSKDISKIERSIALASSRNGAFVFSIKDIGRIVADSADEFTAKTHYVREHDNYYKNYCFENTIAKNITLNEKPLLFSEIGDFLDSIPEIAIDTLKKIQEPDIQNNFLHCFDDISQLKPFLNQNADKQDLNKVKKIQAEGIDFDEIKVGRGVYDYLSYHNNGKKYIEFKSSIFKKLEWYHNSYIYDEFEMDNSSELNIYSKNGELINKCTVFLCPNKSFETVIIFEVNKNDLLKIENWLFTSIERIKSLLTHKSHFVNCVNDEIDLEAAPPVLLNSSTQDVLGYLANYVPNKDFALYRRWNDFFDEIYVTSPDSKNFRNDYQLTEFPGSENMDEEAYEYDYYEPCHFYVYEKEVFESLKLKGDRLKLEVSIYKDNPLL
jgi:antitoxin component YwqK of YwqJK toxin-antitoxin module